MTNGENDQDKDKHPILPKLKNENRRLANFSKSGIWDFRGKTALDELSDSLDVQTYASEINSIPDIWARPLLFEMALFNDKHKLHQLILGEWRGLLAIFALRKMLRLDELKAVNLDLNVFDNEQSKRDPFLQFAPAAINLIPKETLASSGASWRYLYMFVFGERAIGMTSPTTLVVTAADYHNVIQNPRITWYVNGRLEDPVQRLSNNLKAHLSGWIGKLRIFINAYPHKNNKEEIVQKWTYLGNLLRDFQNDLGTPAAVTLVDQPRLNIVGEKAVFFSFLNNTCLESGQGSDVLLKNSAQRNPVRKIILTDLEIADQWHLSAHNITVWGSTTLDIARPPHGNISNRNHLTQAAEDWRSEEFFTSKLFLLPKDSFPGAMPLNEPFVWQDEEYSPLLPLKKVIIEQFTAAELARLVNFRAVDEGIEVSVNLPLSGADNQERIYSAVKIYKKDESIVTTLTTPVLEIFPNFTSTTWKAYYTCYSTDVLSATFNVTPFAGQNEVLDYIDYPMGKSGSGKRCFWRTNTFPELLLCRASFPNQNRSGMEEVEAGVLLIRQPESQPPDGTIAANSIYSLGIDFGASGTNVYANLNNNAAPAPVNFKKRIWTITTVSAADRVELYNYFLPDDELEAPYLSIYHSFENYDFNAPANAQNHLEFEALRNGHIFFFSEYERFNARGKGIKVNLKWSDEPEDRVMIGAFLLQICLQSAAEAICKGASRMQVSYSYPAAFSEQQKTDLNQQWRTILPLCQNLTGLTIRVQDLTDQTESVASANFFMHHSLTNAVLDTGAIIIDIGSSTSDISIWGRGASDNNPRQKRNTLLRQMSLLFAGDNLFLSYLYQNPRFLENVFNISSTTLINLHQASDRSGFNAQANALLRRFSDYIFQELPKKSGTDNVKKLKQHLALGLSGIFYFLGLNVRQLIEQKNFPAQTPNIFIGGNGSRMFRWFDATAEHYNNNSPLNAFFRNVFLRAANLPSAGAQENINIQTAATLDMNSRLSDNFRLLSSPLPKAEAAYGLVCGGQTYIPKNTTAIIAGEKFKFDNQIYSWSKILTNEMLSDGIEEINNLPMLTDFLDTFNNLAGDNAIDEIVLENQVLEETKRQLHNTLGEFMGKVPKTIHVEPVFILALKHFLIERIRYDRAN